MTTYPKTLLTDAIYSNGPLRPFQISYFGERFRNRLHAEVLKLFDRASRERGLTKADLARRLNKRPEQITRWLAAPGNWTLDTVSQLMLAMGYEPTVGSQLLAENKTSNYCHPVALKPGMTVEVTPVTAGEKFEKAPIITTGSANQSRWKCTA